MFGLEFGFDDVLSDEKMITLKGALIASSFSKSSSTRPHRVWAPNLSEAHSLSQAKSTRPPSPFCSVHVNSTRYSFQPFSLFGTASQSSGQIFMNWFLI